MILIYTWILARRSGILKFVEWQRPTVMLFFVFNRTILALGYHFQELAALLVGHTGIRQP